jgi:ribosome maturation factor RimP
VGRLEIEICKQVSEQVSGQISEQVSYFTIYFLFIGSPFFTPKPLPIK